MKQFLVICKVEFRLFSRDFFGIFFALVFPLLMLLVFGGIYGNEPMGAGVDAMRTDGYGSGNIEVPNGYEVGNGKIPDVSVEGNTKGPDVSASGNAGMMDVCVPAYAVMVIGVTGLMSLPLTLANCKEKKIYKRFDATPVGKKMILLAQVFVNFIMAIIGILILLTAGKIIYHIQIRGAFFEVCIAVLFSVAAMFSMGFLFTAIGKDLKSASFLCYLFYFIMLFLSGATIPDMLFPETMKTIAKFLPMTYAVDLMQGVFAGNGLLEYGVEVLVLGASTVVFALVGAILYRGRDWT